MKYALLSAVLLLAHPCRAQISISADVDKTSVAMNDQIVLGVTVTGPEASLPDPEIPSLPNFSIYSSGRQQSISFVNGRVSSSITFTYVLEPRSVGKGIIPPISLTYQGKTAKTQPIEIQVFKPGSPAPAPAGSPSAAPKGHGGQAPAAAQPQAHPGGAAPVFVQATIDNKSPFVNEQATLTVRFYTAVTLLGRPQYSSPKTDGFLAEDLPPERHGDTDIQGRTYYYSEIKTALFPAQAGKLTVGPATVRVQLQAASNVDPFAADFFQRFMAGSLVNAVARDLSSDPLIVNAQALPSSGKPADFSGSVGRYSVAAAVDRSSAKVGDAVNLIVTVSGAGNIKAIGDPKMPDLSNFRVFDTVSSLNLDKKGDRVSGSKVFRTVLVPRVSGDLAIPPVSFSFFDPSKKAYEEAQSQPLVVKVAPAPAGTVVPAGNAAGVAAPQGVTAVSQDIRYLKTGGARPVSRTLESLAGLGVLNGTPFAVFAFSCMLVGYRKMESSDPAGARYRGAARAAMKTIDASLKAGDAQKAAGLMAEALSAYLADKLGQSASGLTMKRVAELLSERRPPVPPELVEEVREVWEDLDMRRFAPKAAGGGAAVAKAVRAVIDALEKEFKK